MGEVSNWAQTVSIVAAAGTTMPTTALVQIATTTVRLTETTISVFVLQIHLEKDLLCLRM